MAHPMTQLETIVVAMVVQMEAQDRQPQVHRLQQLLVQGLLVALDRVQQQKPSAVARHTQVAAAAVLLGHPGREAQVVYREEAQVAHILEQVVITLLELLELQTQAVAVAVVLTAMPLHRVAKAVAA